MEEEGLNRISLRIPEDLFDEIKRKAFEDRTTFQAIGLDLFTQWLRGDRELSPPPDDPAIERFREFLSGGAAPERKKALRIALEVFLENEDRRHRGKGRVAP